MSTSHVPPEVWINIMKQLLQPIPLPLSKPARSALRQPGMCSMMRVCKLFQKLAEPLLYRHLVTDCLPLLFCNITPKEISDETPLSKARLRQFAHTKSLTIEYGEKGSDPHWTYGLLFGLYERAAAEVNRDRWECIGVSSEERNRLLIYHCKQELEDLNEYLSEIAKTKMSAVLPRLEVVRIASIYGFEPGTWRHFERTAVDLRSSDGRRAILPETWRSSENFHKFLATGKKALRAIRVRDTYGPLAIPNRGIMGPQEYPGRKIIHFSGDIAKLPFPLGYPSRWMLDGPPVYNWDALIRRLGFRLRQAQAHRRLLAPSQHIDLILGCSTSHSSSAQFDPGLLDQPPPPSSSEPGIHTLSANDQRHRASQLGTILRGLLGKNAFDEDIPRNDRLEWQSAADSTSCEACGYSCEV